MNSCNHLLNDLELPNTIGAMISREQLSTRWLQDVFYNAQWDVVIGCDLS